MRTGGECAGDCESTVHSSAIRCAATRNKGPQWRWQPQPATGVPITLKWGYTQRHARPMQDKVVIQRMKGTLARRTGSGAAVVWVGGWLHLNATNRYVEKEHQGAGAVALQAPPSTESPSTIMPHCVRTSKGKGQWGRRCWGGGCVRVAACLQ